MIKIIFMMLKEMYESKIILGLTLLIGIIIIMISIIVVENFNGIISGASIIT